MKNKRIEMTENHLKNVASMLKRKASNLVHEGGLALSYSGGEMAEYYAHQGGNFILDKAEKYSRFACLVEEFLKLKYS
jgi:hypothetical protein